MGAKSVRMLVTGVAVLLALLVSVAPSLAQSTTSYSQVLQPGQSVEYRLNYLGDNGGVTVVVGSNPARKVSFNVYTDQAWMNGADPIGRGTVQNIRYGNPLATPSALYAGRLVWHTADKSGGLYHIQITNNSDQVVTVTISANGGGNGALYPFP